MTVRKDFLLDPKEGITNRTVDVIKSSKILIKDNKGQWWKESFRLWKPRLVTSRLSAKLFVGVVAPWYNPLTLHPE